MQEMREYTYKTEVRTVDTKGFVKILRRPGDVVLQKKDRFGYWRDYDDTLPARQSTMRGRVATS
jgi:hypothetical protein